MYKYVKRKMFLLRSKEKNDGFCIPGLAKQDE